MKTTKAEIAAIVASADLAGLRKLDPAAQLRVLRGQRIERVLKVQRDGIDEEKRTVWLAASSEEPYERWWGIEILDHSPKSIRTERLKSGLAVLVGHDTDKHVGIVDDFVIAADRRLRVLARFGKSAFAEEKFRDVLDGILVNVSIGYVIEDLQLLKSEEGVNTYVVTDWTPLEVSLVAVPADPTVGVGRAHEPPEVPAPAQPQPAKDTMKTEQEIAAENKAAQDKAALEARQAEQKRVSDLLAAGEQYAKHGGPEVAMAIIKDPNGTLEQFREKMLAKLATKGSPTPTAEPHEERLAHGEGARVRFRYGKLRAFTRDLTLKDGQSMKAEEAAYRSGMWLAATVFGKQWAHKWCRDNGFDIYVRGEDGQVRVMGGNTLTAGGALVPVEMEQAIIDLRDEYGVARKLLRVRPMASDQLVIPRRTGGLTAYFFNDEDGTGITASDKSWDQVTLSAKKLGVLARVSNDLVEDAVIDVVDDLAQEMGYAFAVKEDQCMIDGDGTSTYGGMQGFRPRFVATAYASRYSLAANHDTFAEVNAADLAGVMASVAKYGEMGAKWLISQTGKALSFDSLKASAGGNDLITLGQRTAPAYLGYEIVTSEAMPAGAATDYSSLVMFMFGRFDLAGSMGNRRGIEIQVLRERYAELGQLGIVGTERFDINIHDLGSTTAKGPVAAGYGAA